GVSLGVTTVIGVADISESVLASFRHMVQTVAGASDLEITASGAGVPEEMVAAAARISGVEATAGLVEAFLALPERPEESLYVLGLDFLGSPVWHDQLPRDAIDIPDELAFVAQTNSVMITRRVASRIRVEEGDQ